MADQIDCAASAGTSLGEGGNVHDESIERYSSMFTHHPHAAFSVDARGNYTAANSRALEMTGLSLEEMKRTRFSQVIHPDDLDLLEDGFGRAMAGEPQVVEARVVRADGAVVDIRCTAIPVVVAGEVVGLHGITEDVTDAHQVVRQLQEANAAKSLFLATVSHEVRTPLAVLVGATDLLMGAEVEAERDHYAHMVHRSSQRLMQLVDDILEFSGLDEGRTVLRPRPFEVRTVVDDMAGWAIPLAESRRLTLSLCVDDTVPVTAVGDALRVSQVVTNLVENAIKFTECGGVDIRVTAHTVASHTWVRFSVTDTGIGISQEHQDSLFEPFTQANPHACGDRQGIGLGLAISRQLVDLMGGQLHVCSTLGGGSTFTFGVPLAVDPDPATASVGG